MLRNVWRYTVVEGKKLEPCHLDIEPYTTILMPHGKVLILWLVRSIMGNHGCSRHYSCYINKKSRVYPSNHNYVRIFFVIEATDYCVHKHYGQVNGPPTGTLLKNGYI